MKVLLLEHPRRVAPERCNDIANTPLSSSLITGSTAGMLASRGHEVKIVEGYLDKLSYEEILNIVSDFAPDILGTHLIYNWENNKDLFSFLEKVKPEGIVSEIIGYGFYPTFAYEEIFRFCPAFDGLIIGEPEETFAQVADKKIDQAAGVPGLAWIDASGQVQVERREVIKNLDLLPHPVRSEAMMRMTEVNLEGSRGCYGGCTFCYINSYYGAGSCWRGRSPEYIMGEIDRIMAEYGKKKFYFTDPNFFGPGRRGQERALKLAALLKERNVRFGIEARVNDIHENTIAALVDAGLEDILVGLESGKDESLRRLNKMTTVLQNERALKILRSYRIEPNVGFIMFEPDSSLSDIRTNLEFLERNDLLKNLFITANVLYHPQIILQGTRAYQQLQKEGRLKLRSTTYEGMTGYSDSQVAILARVIGEITNYFFVKMDDVWSGKIKEPQNVQSIYDRLNHILVKYFTDTLTQLESGQTLTQEDAADLIKVGSQQIDLAFSEFTPFKEDSMLPESAAYFGGNC